MAVEPGLEISEKFFSIQGESTLAGFPCVFFRLSGCNLRCRYCDARYAYEEPGAIVSLAELLAYADLYPKALVEITGGEPLLQENVYPLMEKLLASGRKVLLETNGSINLSRVPAGIIKIMDIKCPDSGMAGHFDQTNLDLLGPTDEIKFVISSKKDYDWAAGLVQGPLANIGVAAINFSPIVADLSPPLIADWLLRDCLPIRLQLQLHKILWPAITRGA